MIVRSNARVFNSFPLLPRAIINLATPLSPLLSIQYLSNGLRTVQIPRHECITKDWKGKKKKKKGNPRRKNRDYTNGISICRAVSHVHSLPQSFTIYKLSSNIYQRCTAPSSRLAFIFWCATTRPAKGTVNSEFSFVTATVNRLGTRRSNTDKIIRDSTDRPAFRPPCGSLVSFRDSKRNPRNPRESIKPGLLSK